jgi:hypothetical protein
MLGSCKDATRTIKKWVGRGGLLVALMLVVGQSGLMVASAGTSDRSREVGSVSDTTVVTTGGSADSSGGGPSIAMREPRGNGTVEPAPLAAGADKVTVKWYGQSPTTYNHTTGAQTTGSSSDAVPELEAEDFKCLDKVAYYAILEGEGGLVGTNTTTLALNFAKKTTSNEAFGFSAGVSYALETGGVSSRDGGEGLSPASPGGFGSTATHVTLTFSVSDVEANELIPVRVLVTLGNCGPGSTTGNVHATVDSAATVNNATGGSVQTSGGNQTVPLKFQGKPTGTITIVKDLIPAADPGTFNLQLEGNTLATGGDSTSTGAQNMLQGTYAVGETGAGGTNLADYDSQIVCQNGTNPALTPVVGTSTNVTVAGGDVWVCTITNTRKIVPTTGTITVNKVLSPTSDPGLFNLVIDGVPQASDVGNGGTTGAITVTAGSTYTVGETAGTGTSLGNYDSTVECHLSGSPAGTSVVGTSKTVVVAAGENWICTITNTRKAVPTTGTIRVNKVLSPSTDPGKFNLQIDGTTAGTGGNVGNGGTTGTITVTAGSHSVGETAGTSTTLGNYDSQIVCQNGTNPALPAVAGTSTNVAVAAGDAWVCTITNTLKSTPPPPPPPPPAGAVQIDKTGPAMTHIGDTITYSFAVSLVSGSSNVSNVSVSDPICNTGTLTVPTKTGGDQDTTLEQGEIWTYSCQHLVTASDPDPLPNTAIVSGVDANGNAVSDGDSHAVDIIHPEITIVKEAAPRSGSPGDRIEYTYKVTNSGDVTLYEVSVDDDVLGHVCTIKQFDPGQTKTCTASYVIPEDAGITITNIVIVGATDPLGLEVSDEDEATIDVVLGATITPTKTPPGGVAFTGTSAAIPLGGMALLFLTIGTALMWAGRRRGEHAAP